MEISGKVNTWIAEVDFNLAEERVRKGEETVNYAVTKY